MANQSNLILAVRGMPLAEVFAFAIEREREAQRFYATARDLVRDPGGRAMLAELHDEEVAHERMLVDARENRRVEIVLTLPQGGSGDTPVKQPNETGV